MSRSVIHVNRQHIAYNSKNGNVLPVYTIKTGGKTWYGFGININGPSWFIDPRENEQLSCGARAWLETDAQIEIVGKMTFKQSLKLKEKLNIKEF